MSSHLLYGLVILLWTSVLIQESECCGRKPRKCDNPSLFGHSLSLVKRDIPDLPNEEIKTDLEYLEETDDTGYLYHRVKRMVIVGYVLPDYVYRVIRPDETPNYGITAKNPYASYGIHDFVCNGHLRTQYIATTGKISIARRWARRYNQRIVRINLNMVKNAGLTITDLRYGGDFCTGGKAYNYSKASNEIVIHGGTIPAEAVQIYH